MQGRIQIRGLDVRAADDCLRFKNVRKKLRVVTIILEKRVFFRFVAENVLWFFFGFLDPKKFGFTKNEAKIKRVCLLGNYIRELVWFWI